MSSDARKSRVVRPACAADAPVLGRLGAVLVSLHHAFDAERFIPTDPNTPSAYGAFLTSQLKRSDVIVLVAVGERGVLGYAYAGLEGNDYMALRGPAGVLYDLVVDPDFRGQGVGRLLLEAMLAQLAAKGAPRVVLSAAERNETAQSLFASAGFRRTMIEMTRELGESPPA